MYQGHSQSIRRMTGMGLILLSGWILGSLSHGPESLVAETRKGLPRKAFQSGSERSETQLKEIASLLKTINLRIEKMDSRLENIENNTSSLDRKIQITK